MQAALRFTHACSRQALSSLLLLLFLGSAGSPRVKAQDYYWDSDGSGVGLGGNGNWDTGSALWHLGSTSGNLVTWPPSGGSHNAFLEGTNGTLTLMTGITAQSLNASPTSGNYIVTGVAQALSLGGASTPSIAVSSGSSLIITSQLAGTQGFTKTGNGTLVLDMPEGTGSVLGPITVSGGTLQAGSAANNAASQALRSNAVNLAGGTTLSTVGTTIDLRVGALSGSGSVTPATGGAINVLAREDATFSGAITTTGGLNLRGANGTTQTFNGNLTGLTGTIGINSGATLKLSGTGDSTSGVLGAGTIALRGGTFTLDNSGGNTSAAAGRIVDTADFTFLGGTFSFIGHSGGSTETVDNITLNDGSATISVTHNGGAGGTVLTFDDGGTIRDSTAMTVKFVGIGGTLGTAGANPRIVFTSALNNNTANGMLSHGASSATVATIGWARVNNTSWAGNGANGIYALTDTARTDANLSSAGANELVAFTPGVATTTLTSSLGVAALKITPSATGQTLALNTGSVLLNTNALMLAGSTDFAITGGGWGTYGSGGTRYVYVTEAGTTLSMSSNMAANSNPFNKSGAGTLFLNGASNQLGFSSNQNINVLEGVLRGTLTSLGGGASTDGDFSTINLRGGVLEISGGGTFARAIDLAGTTGGGGLRFDADSDARGDGGFSAHNGNATVTLVTTIGGSTAATLLWNDNAFLSNGYALTMGSTKADSRIDLTNNIALDDSTATNSYFSREIRVADNTSSTGDVARLSGAISGSANADMLKTGAGVLELSGTNTFAGNVLIREGALVASNGSALPDTGIVDLANVPGAALRLDASETIGMVVGGGPSGGNVNLQGNTLTTGDHRTGVYAGVISGTGGSVIKQGEGMLVLTGLNDYTGTTTVSAGNLQVGVAGVGKTGTGDVTVNGSGAVLSGTGSVEGNLTVNQGTLKPGDDGGADAGALNTKSLTFTPVSASTVAELQIVNGSSYDSISVTGDLALNSFSNIVVDGTGYVPVVGNIFHLLDWSLAFAAGGFSTGTNYRDGSGDTGTNLDLPDISSSGYVWDISEMIDGGALTITVVPEPSRVLLLLVGVAGLVMRRRR